MDHFCLNVACCPAADCMLIASVWINGKHLDHQSFITKRNSLIPYTWNWYSFSTSAPRYAIFILPKVTVLLTFSCPCYYAAVPVFIALATSHHVHILFLFKEFFSTSVILYPAIMFPSFNIFLHHQTMMNAVSTSVSINLKQFIIFVKLFCPLSILNQSKLNNINTNNIFRTCFRHTVNLQWIPQELAAIMQLAVG